MNADKRVPKLAQLSLCLELSSSSLESCNKTFIIPLILTVSDKLFFLQINTSVFVNLIVLPSKIRKVYAPQVGQYTHVDHFITKNVVFFKRI